MSFFVFSKPNKGVFVAYNKVVMAWTNQWTESQTSTLVNVAKSWRRAFHMRTIKIAAVWQEFLGIHVSPGEAGQYRLTDRQTDIQKVGQTDNSEVTWWSRLIQMDGQTDNGKVILMCQSACRGVINWEWIATEGHYHNRS